MAVLALLIAFLAAPPATAADGDLAGFEGVREITPTKADSSCIGNPKTPLCAVETFMACWVREDYALCDLAGVESVSLGNDIERHIRYSVRRITTYTQKEHERLDRLWWSKPGNVNVEVDESYCDGGGRNCSSFIHFGYAVSRNNGRWKIESWGSSDEADEEFAD